MTCPLCAAIRDGMPITPDTPLPCRARPDTHEPDPADPFHGAVFSPPPGQRDFDPALIAALSQYEQSTAPADRVAAHAPFLLQAQTHLATAGDGVVQDLLARDKAHGLNPTPLVEHPLDALTRKDPV